MLMKRLFTVLMLVLPLSLQAQMQFGYMRYKTVMAEMPEYAQAKQSMAELKAKYDAEATRGEEEFQKKFVDFLQGQKDFPQTIMQKRQAELQSLMENGIAFRMKSQQTLEQAEKDLMEEVKKKLNNIILEVGVEYGYAFVLNTDDDACPFINPVIGVNVTDLVSCGAAAGRPTGSGRSACRPTHAATGRAAGSAAGSASAATRATGTASRTTGTATRAGTSTTLN